MVIGLDQGRLRHIGLGDVSPTKKLGGLTKVDEISKIGGCRTKCFTYTICNTLLSSMSLFNTSLNLVNNHGGKLYVCAVSGTLNMQVTALSCETGGRQHRL